MPKLNTSGGSVWSASRRNRLALILALLGIDNLSKSFAGLFLVNPTDRTTVQHAKIRKIIPELHRRIIEKKPIHTLSKQEKIINFESLKVYDISEVYSEKFSANLVPRVRVALSSGMGKGFGRYFIYDYYYVPKHNYYILLYIIIITL